MMNFPRTAVVCAALLFSVVQSANAQDAPRVVTDILPVHSLVAQIMEGVGAPDLLLEAGSDPHNYAMRPSQASLLENADVVIVIGPALTPWLEKPLATLANGATQVILLEVLGTELLEYRGGHDHGHGHGHDDENVDPHAWLDPKNAKVWLSSIADTLAQNDPANSALYLANAETARAELTNLEAEWQAALDGVGRYGVHHDAYQYFEARFGLATGFVIKEDDAHQPGPARIAELRADIAQNAVACVFVEPFVNRGLIETVLEGSDAKILELDQMGVNFEPGPDLFSLVLREMVASVAQCR
ncbi:MAG: zinc ABC transporter substrate-binding protein [Paracoccaceae bacterium]